MTLFSSKKIDFYFKELICLDERKVVSWCQIKCILSQVSSHFNCKKRVSQFIHVVNMCINNNISGRINNNQIIEGSKNMARKLIRMQSSVFLLIVLILSSTIESVIFSGCFLNCFPNREKKEKKSDKELACFRPCLRDSKESKRYKTLDCYSMCIMKCFLGADPFPDAPENREWNEANADHGVTLVLSNCYGPPYDLYCI